MMKYLFVLIFIFTTCEDQRPSTNNGDQNITSLTKSSRPNPPIDKKIAIKKIYPNFNDNDINLLIKKGYTQKDKNLDKKLKLLNNNDQLTKQQIDKLYKAGFNEKDGDNGNLEKELKFLQQYENLKHKDIKQLMKKGYKYNDPHLYSKSILINNNPSYDKPKIDQEYKKEIINKQYTYKFSDQDFEILFNKGYDDNEFYLDKKLALIKKNPKLSKSEIDLLQEAGYSQKDKTNFEEDLKYLNKNSELKKTYIENLKLKNIESSDNKLLEKAKLLEHDISFDKNDLDILTKRDINPKDNPKLALQYFKNNPNLSKKDYYSLSLYDIKPDEKDLDVKSFILRSNPDGINLKNNAQFENNVTKYKNIWIKNGNYSK